MSRLWRDNSTDRIWRDNSTDRLWRDSVESVAADAGAYVLTGSDAILEVGGDLSADAGAYVLTGSDAVLIDTADKGTYALTGSDIDFAFGINFDVEAGTYSLTWGDIPRINAEPGTYAITGTDVSKVIAADEGVYTIAGSEARFNRIFLEPGALSLTGADVNFKIDLNKIQPGTVCYLFTLTGTPDIEIPIKSLQARLRSGDPTYLQVVIPGMDQASAITARADGTMKIDLARRIGGEYVQRETIIEANLEDIRVDKGTVNQSITLTGHKQKTYVKKSMVLSGATFENMLNGRIRYRLAESNVYLNPGDSVTIGTDTFDADVISYFISARRTHMELAEAS